MNEIKDENRTLKEQINLAKQALAIAYSNLDNVTDPALIDCCIYRVNSEQIRYEYLLAKAKELKI